METSKSKDVTCPGCGKPVDPLRAGHVSIDASGFRYFCGAECKRAYVQAVSTSRLAADAVTADPPPVAPRSIAVDLDIRSPTTERGRVVGAGPSPSLRQEPVATSGGSVEGVGAEALDDEGLDGPVPEVAYEPSDGDGERDLPHEGDAPNVTPEETEPSPAPPTARSMVHGGAATSRVRPSNARSFAARVTSLEASLIPLGIVCGVLSAAVSLSAESLAVTRVPLALASALLLGVYRLRSRRALETLSAWALLGPVALAAVVALATRAEQAATFCGLASASGLLVEWLFARACRDVVRARERFSSGLSVGARVVQRAPAEAARGADESEEVRAAEVKPGEHVLVEAGQTIPVDGQILRGSAEIAPWLDSPVVGHKGEGDAVVAGASVLEGRIVVTATFTGGERAWLRHLHVRDGREADVAPSVRLVRRVVERAIPVVAVGIAFVSYASGERWPLALLAASAGAFMLGAGSAISATALAHARGQVAALRRGIVYKDPRSFEIAARADLAVLCARGTVLLGEPEIVVVEATAGRDTARVLALAAGAESASSGAVAAAIVREARARNVALESVRSSLVHPGLGVTALVSSGEKVIVGSRAFLLKEKVSVAVADGRVAELEALGRSVVLVALGGRLVGLLALQDGLRVGARAAVQRLYNARIEPILLSGEARETVQTIARSLDIEHVRPEVLPADRDAEVRSLSDGGHVIAALGHPGSDDGALGAADVGVAMNAAGIAPGEWGVVLASDDVRDAALSLTVPRACRERAKRAVIVCAGAQVLGALGVGFGIVPLAASPVLGVLATAVAFALVRAPTMTSSRTEPEA